MRFGVVIPHFNDSRFLRESLLACLTDSPAPDSLMVVDDGSSDSERAAAAQIVASLQVDYRTQIRFHAVPRNLGPIGAQNIGLNLSDCDFVQFRAADDRSAPGFLRHMRPLCERHPTVGLVVGDIVYRPESGQSGVLESLRLGQAGYIGPDTLAASLNAARILHSAAVWYNAHVFRQSGGFSSEADLYHDWWACHQLALRHGIVYIPQPAVYFTLRRDSQSSTHYQDGARARRSADGVRRLVGGEDPMVRRRFVESGILDFFGAVHGNEIASTHISTSGGIPEVLRSRLSRLHDRISAVSDGVWVYGTGNHSQYLSTAWQALELPEIRGFVQTVVLPGDPSTFLNKPVVSIDSLDMREVILIVLSSKSFEEAMASNCGKLARKPKILSFWNEDLTTL